MVELPRLATRQDAAPVGLEPGCIDANGDWPTGKSRLERVGGLLNRLHARDAASWDCGGAAARCAAAIPRPVWVTGLAAHGVGLPVLHSPVHVTTIATGRRRVAINQLLLAEGLELAGGNLIRAFHGTSCTESPA